MSAPPPRPPLVLLESVSALQRKLVTEERELQDRLQQMEERIRSADRLVVVCC
jgi:hypothetical protein